MTISHLRFGSQPIRSAYLIHQASFVACHSFHFLERFDIAGYAKPGGVLLLNTPFELDAVWKQLPREVQQQIVQKKLKVYVIDAYRAAREAGMGRRINTVMQTCFFAISGVLPREEAIARIKKAIEKTYAKKGEEMCARTSRPWMARSRTFMNCRFRANPLPAGRPFRRFRLKRLISSRISRR